MRSLVTAALALTLVSAFPACAGQTMPHGSPPLAGLSDVDNLTVLIHHERSGAPISRDGLEDTVLRAFARAGVRVTHGVPPYFHVRVYCRCGEPDVSDLVSPRDAATTWHLGMWVDQSDGYVRTWGPLTNICPTGPVMWSRGGTGLVAERTLLDSIQTWLSEFVADYHDANADR